MRWLQRFGVLLLIGCVSACGFETVPCGDGVCPPGTTCAYTSDATAVCAHLECSPSVEGQYCVYGEQLSVCGRNECQAQTCLNGELEEYEECDPTVIYGDVEECIDRGYFAGAINCTQSCQASEELCWNPGWKLLPSGTTVNLYTAQVTGGGRFFLGGASSTLLTRTAESDGWKPVENLQNACRGMPVYEVLGLAVSSRDATTERVLMVTENGLAFVVDVAGDTAEYCELLTIDVQNLERSYSAWLDDTGEHAWIATGRGDVFAWEADDATPYPPFLLAPLDIASSAVWGRHATEVYAGGHLGEVRRWDGYQWLPMPDVPGAPRIYALWGPPDATTIYSLSEGGAVHQLQGGQWEALPPVTVQSSVWYELKGTREDDLWVVGDQGNIAQFNGLAWSYYPAYTYTVLSLAVHSEQGVVAVGQGGTTMQWQGLSWNEIDVAPVETLYGVTATDGGQIYAAGNAGTVVRMDRSLWEPECVDADSDLRDVWVQGDHAFVVGLSDTILTRDATCWVPLAHEASPTTDWLAIHGVQDAGATLAIAVGTNGGLTLFNLGQNQQWQLEAPLTTSDLYGVWVASVYPETEAYVVGEKGEIWRYRSGAWSQLEVPHFDPTDDPPDLFSVWGNENLVVFVGENGTVWELDRKTPGATVSAVATTVYQDLYAIFGPPDSEELFVGGYRSTWLYFDGVHWSSMNPVDCRWTRRNIRSIGGSHRSSVFAVGDAGCVLHFTGRLPRPAS